jgi:hypothetical protein
LAFARPSLYVEWPKESSAGDEERGKFEKIHLIQDSNRRPSGL